ncbi:fumarylacetoacetate hydrolase family protein [Ammonicoccus fulvus]|uniref:Fumarylacetoacetate hydrolase family protein n=1 Tax=Ammonicoccus fulvus TaxID=3138240 RepID=A0ABZ3FWJ4_9ACTN
MSGVVQWLMDSSAIERIVDELETAERTAVGVPTLSSRPEGLTESDAWAIAGARDARRLARGERRVGYKLGWTSSAMREALGIDQPNHGSLWAGMECDGTLSMAERIHPKAEPEFAYRAGRTLSGNVTAAEVAESGEWAVSLEIVDPRWESYRFAFVDNTADSSSAAGYQLGEFHRCVGDPVDFELTMRIDGAEERSASGRVVFGSPAESVAFLVRRLAESGASLHEGMIVLTGGATAPVDLVVGTRLEVWSPQLGSCELDVVA